MDRLNLKQLSIVSSITLVLAACSTPAPKQEAAQEIAPAPESQEVVQKKQELTEKVEAKKADAEQAVESAVVEAKEAVEEVAAEVEPKKIEPEPVAPAKEEPVVEEVVKKAPQPAAPAKQVFQKSSEPNTFIVNSGPKDQGHPFFGVGDRRGFIVDGEQGKTLVLTRGEEYKFLVDTGVQHDFYFSTSEKGWGAGTITDGIEGQFTYDGTVVVKPNPATPSVMFYQCRNHKNMGGKIHVINKGETVKLDESGPAKGGKANKPAFKVTKQQVKQKLAYAKMLMMAEWAKKLDEGGNEEAKSLAGQAKDYLNNADTALAAKKNVEAMASVDEALRLINAAKRIAPTEKKDDGIDYKPQYDEMLAEIEGYKKSYGKNLSKSGKKDGAQLDEKKFNDLMAKAKKLADAGDHKAAMKPLQSASTMITDVISRMLDDTVVVYDKNFATPKEELEYEVSRYDSYLELIPLAKEQRNPSPRQLKAMDQYVNKAKKIVSEGEEIAKKGDYKLAIQAYQAATSNLKRALMLVGVR